MDIVPANRIPDVPVVKREERIDLSQRRKQKEGKKKNEKKEQGKVDIRV